MEHATRVPLSGHWACNVIDGLTGKLLRATWQDQPVRVGLCDPVANRSRPRPKTPAPAPIRKTTPFDPIAALLQKAREEVPHD